MYVSCQPILCILAPIVADAFAIPAGTYGEGEDGLFIWLSGVECRGHESTILECTNSGPGFITPCKHRNDTGVLCAGGTYTCSGRLSVKHLIGITMYCQSAPTSLIAIILWCKSLISYCIYMHKFMCGRHCIKC